MGTCWAVFGARLHSTPAACARTRAYVARSNRAIRSRRGRAALQATLFLNVQSIYFIRHQNPTRSAMMHVRFTLHRAAPYSWTSNTARPRSEVPIAHILRPQLHASTVCPTPTHPLLESADILSSERRFRHPSRMPKIHIVRVGIGAWGQ
ncbi:hypothetical protein HYPSUDRAFT_337871 [Hypholoma sublateritium FD-334 SS-4]|uniref:Uncharacterized protein n=1 Tax=Hypholoma sublateritium (strain FD-334 SS-4) TaxID=945553 RepID=A0A0D2KME5_HYPSF|nr:hypothetical protein HYPSUDRAFT_337871 [Hypholoma sublateritium FD-334 SS-4]